MLVENFEIWKAREEKNNNVKLNKVKLNNFKTLDGEIINFYVLFNQSTFRSTRSLFTGKNCININVTYN